MRMTLPDTYRSQLQHIQESPKFQPHPKKGFQAVPFPGYTIITPPGRGEVAENQALYDRLQHFQEQLLQELGSEVFAPVPAESFHLTLADLIWDSAYRHASEAPGFETQLQERVTQIFREYRPMRGGKSVHFQVLGLMLMTRAIAVCLVPTEEASYERILKFRRAVYQNPDLIGLGIEQQYYFTPHVTLGYFGDVPPLEERWQLSDRLATLNQQWLEGDAHVFGVHQAELRKFDNMAHYYREPDWPVFEF